MDQAALILRGLGGQHLYGFLPGRDNKAAISAAASGMLGWSIGSVFGNVTRQGIGEWPHFQHHSARKPGNADRFITWPEVLAVIERGCADGYRERYEEAQQAWRAEIGPYDPALGTCSYPSRAACDRLREATAALIRHGCQQVTVQEALW